MGAKLKDIPPYSDLAALDAHIITQEEYDEMPELTDEMLARGEIACGNRLIRPGDGPLTHAMMARFNAEQISNELVQTLSPDVLDYFRSHEAGWMTRLDAALKDWIAMQLSKAS